MQQRSTTTEYEYWTVDLRLQSLTDHVEWPVLVDDDSLGDGGTVDVDDPEQRSEAGPSSHLARQPHVLVADLSRRRPTSNYRTICGQRSQPAAGEFVSH